MFVQLFVNCYLILINLTKVDHHIDWTFMFIAINSELRYSWINDRGNTPTRARTYKGVGASEIIFTLHKLGHVSLHHINTVTATHHINTVTATHHINTVTATHHKNTVTVIHYVNTVTATRHINYNDVVYHVLTT
jgi:hypothetical protein